VAPPSMASGRRILPAGGCISGRFLRKEAIMHSDAEAALDAAPLGHTPARHAGAIEEGIKPCGKLFQVVTGHLWIQVMLQVVGELEEQRGNHATTQRMRLREWRIAEVPVR